MICGKCQSKKQNVLTVQSFQVGQNIVTIHHIPATQCNCTLYISNSVNQEIQGYFEENAAELTTGQMTYSDI